MSSNQVEFLYLESGWLKSKIVTRFLFGGERRVESGKSKDESERRKRKTENGKLKIIKDN